MVGTTIYTYDPISHNQVRLLKFVQDGDRISAILETFSVEQQLPPYNSISYTWTTDGAYDRATADFAVEIDKRLLPVLDSLRPFLEVLRSKGTLLDGTWWWIDSICIDQTNFEERGHQVQLMQQIYRQAAEVIVWLGEASDDSDLAVDFIGLLDEMERQRPSVPEVRNRLQKDEYRAQWAAFLNLISRRWWSRIWTVQEFALPSSVSFWCGLRSVSRLAVCHSITIADKCTAVGIKENLAFAHANNRRRAWKLDIASREPGVDLRLSLPALAAYFCCMDATDDRDRLYGLMALSTDPVLPHADYRLTTEEVYLRFAQSFIEQHKALDIICLASIYNITSDSSPSWVPHWQKRYPLVVPSMASQPANAIGNLRGPQYLEFDVSGYYSASGDREAVCSFEGSALLARGIVVDTVDGLAGSRNFEMVQSSEWDTQSPDGSHSADGTEDILISVCRSLALDRKDRYLRYPMPTTEFFQDFIHLLPRIMTQPDSPGPEELREWFQWVRSLRIQNRTFESILRDSLSSGTDVSDDATPNEDEYYHDTWFGRFFDIVVRLGLRLIVSRNGRIGMAAEKAMKGDLICVLFGCSIPVVLRKSDDGDSFKLIGECCLDGYMDGLALRKPELEERVLVIL
jgi:hypothetical protein